jgi:hypothetical protein
VPFSLYYVLFLSEPGDLAVPTWRKFVLESIPTSAGQSVTLGESIYLFTTAWIHSLP